MIASKKILVPADFSDVSVPAIGYAISFAQCLIMPKSSCSTWFPWWTGGPPKKPDLAGGQ
jgi:hypothetical protein